ncbi:MAG: signal peptide peptidase SppA [Leptospiraceae bacterium]|nr:signal peptide peptidase SppA [Leptospiraceae bacterium]
MMFVFLLTFLTFTLSVIKLTTEKTTQSKLQKVSNFSSIMQEGIAKIKLKGIIHNDETLSDGIYAQQVVDWIQEIKDNINLLGVLIEIDSPGGEVGATKMIYNALMSLRKEKPVVVYITNIAASGGYYIASAADKVLSYETAIIGSIGVIMLRPNLQSLLEKIGIEVYVLKSGKYKDISYPFRNLSEEEKEMYNEILETAYMGFISDVALGRKQSEKVVKDDWAEGRIFSAKKAKAYQMIDDFGGEEEAIQALKLMLKTTKDFPIYEPEEDPLKTIFKYLNIKIFSNQRTLPQNQFYQVYYLFFNSSVLNYYFQNLLQ